MIKKEELPCLTFTKWDGRYPVDLPTDDREPFVWGVVRVVCFDLLDGELSGHDGNWRIRAVAYGIIHSSNAVV